MPKISCTLRANPWSRSAKIVSENRHAQARRVAKGGVWVFKHPPWPKCQKKYMQKTPVTVNRNIHRHDIGQYAEERKKVSVTSEILALI